MGHRHRFVHLHLPDPIAHPLTTTDSEVSDVGEDDALDESLLDRIAALKDIVPPAYRRHLSSATSTGYNWASKALSLGGKTLWVVSTSALLLGVPWALAFGEEQQVMEMEREMQMQRNANEVSIFQTAVGGCLEDREANVFDIAAYAGDGRWCETCAVNALQAVADPCCILFAVLYTLLMARIDLHLAVPKSMYSRFNLCAMCD
jgi:import receptor subunit TOM22